MSNIFVFRIWDAQFEILRAPGRGPRASYSVVWSHSIVSCSTWGRCVLLYYDEYMYVICRGPRTIYSMMSLHSAKGGAVETGCSELYDAIYWFTIWYYPNPLHPRSTAAPSAEYPEHYTVWCRIVHYSNWYNIVWSYSINDYSIVWYYGIMSYGTVQHSHPRSLPQTCCEALLRYVQ